MTISLETRGDIFESKASVLLCPANTVGAMGKGLAQVFRHRHPDLYYRYKQQCRKRRFHPETLMLFSPAKSPYKVLMAPTKVHWKDPSPPELVEKTLERIAWLGEQGRIASLALPPLGCGEGGLDFDQVRKWIYQYLDPNPMEVEIWLGP